MENNEIEEEKIPEYKNMFDNLYEINSDNFIENDNDDELERTSFPEPLLDDDDNCDEYYLKCINDLEETNVCEDMFFPYKKFKFDDEDELSNIGVKFFSDKKNYCVNGDCRIKKKTYPKRKESTYSILFNNNFKKENLIDTFKYEVTDTIKTIIKDTNSSLQNVKITFTEKCGENT
jgi:hypothetical protein